MNNDFFENMDETMDKKATADKEAAEAPKFDPNPGDLLKAVLLKADAFVGGQYPPTAVITFKNVGEEAVGNVEPGKTGTLFASTVLRTKLFEAAPAIGQPFGLRFEGTVKPDSGGFSYKNWTVIGSGEDRVLWKGIAERIAGETLSPETQRSQNAQPGDTDWQL